MIEKNIVEIINRHQQNNLLTIDEVNGRTILSDTLERSKRGLYWFWTSYSFEELANSTRPRLINGEINISRLATQRKELNHICKLQLDDFKLVYNGKGGSTGNSYGLRERILQEIRGQEGTGSLSILNSSLNDCTRWRVTYIDFEDENFLAAINEEITYQNDGELFEMLWRLHYGWPLLCRR